MARNTVRCSLRFSWRLQGAGSLDASLGNKTIKPISQTLCPGALGCLSKHTEMPQNISKFLGKYSDTQHLSETII